MIFGEFGKKRRGPLAYRLAPRDFSEFFGQDHLVGEGGILKKLVEKGNVPSSLFFGPPGTGKTSLALIISKKTNLPFFHLNASVSTSSDVKKILEEADRFYKNTNKPIILFIDEIHRFNRLQQEVLLPASEAGKIVLIGSTVLNPFFAIDKALLSRLKIFEFKPLKEKDIISILKKAVGDEERGYGKFNLEIDERVFESIAITSEGDARRALNILELLVETKESNNIGIEDLRKLPLYFRYDRKGDEHYDTISAFIKSLRGSDPDASLYWLFKMIESGEDPRFIFRRMLIFACEDIGLAEPEAIKVATGCAYAFEMVGMPEGEFLLAFLTLFLSLCPKSNSVLRSMARARKVLKEKRFNVPMHLRDSHYKSAKKIGRGEGYRYPHSEPEAVYQKYLPEFVEVAEILGKGKEKIFRQKLKEIRKIRWRKEV